MRFGTRNYSVKGFYDELIDAEGLGEGVHLAERTQLIDASICAGIRNEYETIGHTGGEAVCYARS